MKNNIADVININFKSEDSEDHGREVEHLDQSERDSGRAEDEDKAKAKAKAKAKPGRPKRHPKQDLRDKQATIEVQKGNLDHQYDLAEVVLSHNGFYHRAGNLVRIVGNETIEVEYNNLHVQYLSKMIKWVSYSYTDTGKQITTILNPTESVAKALCGAGNWANIPKIEAISDRFILSKSDVLIKHGYDKNTGIYVSCQPETVSSLPKKPTLDDVRVAMAKLARLLQTFDFEFGHDKAAALCAFLTAVARPILQTAPLVIINAPVAGTGKGLLARIIAFLAAFGEPRASVLADNATEIQKDLVSRLIGCHPVIFYDEVSATEIDSPALRTLATSPIFSARILGASIEVTLSTSSLVLLTGNNVTPKSDTARRVLQIRLDPLCEKPSTRQYEYDPLDDVRRHRQEMVDAVLTIQRAYLQSGEHDEIKRSVSAVGSFEDWNMMCRLPIIWATGLVGLAGAATGPGTRIDPAQRMLASLDEDPRHNELGAVLKAWYKAFICKPVTARDLVNRASENINCALYEALAQVCADNRGNLAPLRLGKWLAKYKDRFVGQMRLQPGTKLDGNQRWVISIAAPVSIPVPDGQVFG